MKKSRALCLFETNLSPSPDFTIGPDYNISNNLHYMSTIRRNITKMKN
jgi:hypothetical protein